MDLVQKSFPVIQQHEILEQAVNARELHGFLASKQNFSNWIKSRINKYDFIENVDYLINKIIVQVPHKLSQKPFTLFGSALTKSA